MPDAVNTGTDQWLRKISLIITDGEKGLDLSNFRIRFQSKQSDGETPNSIAITVSNLADTTANLIQKEYTGVMLEAGYQTGNYGQIFKGTIKQFHRGRESATDTYLTILAADGDIGYNQGFMNETGAAGMTQDDVKKRIAANLKDQGDVVEGYTSEFGGVQFPRGPVFYGMTRYHARVLADTNLMTWSIQGGALTFLSLSGYKPGEAVKMNYKTGMIGMPEQTDNGISVRCLLNPKLQIGGLVQINNGEINQTTYQDASQPIPYDQFTGWQQFASVTDDGLYRLYAVTHVGDTRGNDWYSDLVCLSIDPSAPIGSAVPDGV